MALNYHGIKKFENPQFNVLACYSSLSWSNSKLFRTFDKISDKYSYVVQMFLMILLFLQGTVSQASLLHGLNLFLALSLSLTSRPFLLQTVWTLILMLVQTAPLLPLCALMNPVLCPSAGSSSPSHVHLAAETPTSSWTL